MKQPRVEDFDANAAGRLKSSMDDMPTIAKHPRTATVVHAEGPTAKTGSSMPSTQEPKPIGAKEKVSSVSEHGADDASTLTRYPDSMIGAIRKTVRSVGREVSFCRVTHEEKKRLMDVVYTYRRQGVKTSENEVKRIAVNFLLEDYQANGRASVLARVIDALLA